MGQVKEREVYAKKGNQRTRSDCERIDMKGETQKKGTLTQFYPRFGERPKEGVRELILRMDESIVK